MKLFLALFTLVAPCFAESATPLLFRSPAGPFLVTRWQADRVLLG